MAPRTLVEVDRCFEGGPDGGGRVYVCMYNKRTSNTQSIHSFITGAYSPGRTFGLPFWGYLDHTHTDTR
jgi:hypothetical protein